MSSPKRVTEERLAALLDGSADGDQRERELGQALRALRRDTPPASDALRERVRSLAATEPAREPSFFERVVIRRVVLVVVGACLVAALGAALVRGVMTVAGPQGVRGDGASEAAPAGGSGRETPAADDAAGQAPREPVPKLATPSSTEAQQRLALPHGLPVLPPSRSRAQDYRVFVRVRVDDADVLSRRTKEALRLTRAYGGYVVSVNYGVGDEGDARLELRVPIGRVQEALVRFSDLGAILEQRVSIRDLQGRIEIQGRQIATLRRRIAEIRERLLQPNLDPAERVSLEAELERTQEALVRLRSERTAVVRQARFAKVSLALTTRNPLAVPPAEPGRIERAVRDANSVLAKELALGLYALIVLAPFIVLAALALVGVRAGKRRADQRLLERA